MSAFGSRRRATRLPAYLLLVVALGFALRLYHLDVQSLSYDEAVSAHLADLPTGQMLSWTAADVQPPFYYLLLRLWTGLAGSSEFSLRFLSVWLSLLVVPLLSRITLHLCDGEDTQQRGLPAAGVTALAAAVHPWYVWHAQDARMYSPLLLGGALATLLLLLWGAQGDRARGRLAIALALSYIGLLYTHYLSVGLLAVHALLVAWWAWRDGRGRLLGRYLARVLLPAGLAFLPWLPAAMRTVGTDSSYWQGPIKMGEAARKVIIAFFVGAPAETVIEPTGLALSAVMLLALALALVAGRPRPLVFPLILTAGTAAITGAAFILTPKFNPRYLMLASLGLPILWGLAISSAWRRSAQRRVFGLTALGVLLGGSTAGLSGMYWDSRLTRADFRSAISHIESARRADEPVLLVSGHMYPVWRYYAPATPYVPLPDLRVLSVDATLDLQVADRLRNVLEGATGAWVLLWQEEVTDPMGAVTFLLDQAGVAETQSFWHVRVRHYLFPSGAEIQSPTIPPPPASCHFGEGLRFLGSLPDAAGNVALLWQAMHPLDREIRAQVTVSDNAGHVLLRSHLAPGGDAYPTTLWKPGQVTFVRYNPDTPPGVPAGTYWATVSLYDAASGTPLEVLDSAGNPAGQSCPIGELSLAGHTLGLDPAAVGSHYQLNPMPEAAWPGARLVAAGTCPTQALPPGALLSLPFVWQAQPEEGAAEPAQSLKVSLAYPDGEVRSEQVPISPRYPPEVWRPGEVVLDWLDWRVPADASGGRAELDVSPMNETREEAAWVTLCLLEVASVTREYVAPSPQFPSEVVADGAIRMLGMDVDRAEADAGDAVRVTLYFQAIETPAENYTLFLHLLGEDSRVWAGADSQSQERPTAGWLPGEVVSLQFELAIPPDAPSGYYAFEVGWFRPEEAGMPRLPMSENGKPLPGNAVRVGQLRVR